MIPVELTWHEYALAIHTGELRTLEAIRQGMKRKDGTTANMSDDAEGAAAEMVVAKHLGVYYDGSVNALCRADIEPGVHVRHTTRPNGSLIVRARDIERYEPNEVAVLVTGQRGNYIIVGGIRLGDAQQKRWEKNPNGWGAAWFVPIAALRPLKELI